MERSGQRAFTILEIATVIVVIMILLMMVIPLSQSIMTRAERAKCMTNLRNLYVGASGYLLQQGTWPQIPTTGVQTGQYAEMWIAALKPYGIDRVNWICPSVQRLAENPDFTHIKQRRVDYFPTPFDDKPNTPYRYKGQPWFVERGDVHGNGNLVIFGDGSIEDLKTVIKTPRLNTE